MPESLLTVFLYLAISLLLAINSFIAVFVYRMWRDRGDLKCKRVELPSRRNKLVGHLLENARNEISILTTSLESILPYLIELCDTPYISQIRVRILVLNPNHSFTSDRCHDFNDSPEAFREEMINSIERCLGVSEPLPNFEVRMHRRFPTGMMFRVDNQLVLGFVLHDPRRGPAARGREKPHIVIPADHQVAVAFETHFNTLWQNDSVDVNEATLNRVRSAAPSVDKSALPLAGVQE